MVDAADLKSQMRSFIYAVLSKSVAEVLQSKNKFIAYHFSQMEANSAPGGGVTSCRHSWKRLSQQSWEASRRAVILLFFFHFHPFMQTISIGDAKVFSYEFWHARYIVRVHKLTQFGIFGLGQKKRVLFALVLLVRHALFTSCTFAGTTAIFRLLVFHVYSYA